MAKPILNIADTEFRDWGNGDCFEARIGSIGAAIGARGLGCSLYVVQPGKRAAPFHNHRANEEMFFILAGAGELRIGTERFPVRAGDVIACPPGGPESAHHLINDSQDELRYLAFSTMMHPEVTEYPDSGKFGVRVEVPAGDDGQPRTWRYIGRDSGSLDYWDGENGGQ